MFAAPIGSRTPCDCLRLRTRQRQSLCQSTVACLWVAAVLLALASVQSVAAGRNREHGQRGNGAAGELSTVIGGNGGGFRSRQDRLRHHPQEKFAIVKEPEQQHSEFMKGKSECCFGWVFMAAARNLIGLGNCAREFKSSGEMKQ